MGLKCHLKIKLEHATGLFVSRAPPSVSDLVGLRRGLRISIFSNSQGMLLRLVWDHILSTTALGDKKLFKGFKRRSNTFKGCILIRYLKVTWRTFNNIRSKSSIFKGDKNVAALFPEGRVPYGRVLYGSSTCSICETWGKLLNFSKPQLSHLQSENRLLRVKQTKYKYNIGHIVAFMT